MDGGYSAGGSLALADLLDEHGDKIYPEVLRYYGVDLRGLFLSELDAKTALCLVYALPPDSMTYAALTNDKDTAGWGITEHLLAGVIDAVQQNTFTNVQVRTKKRLTPLRRLFPVLGSLAAGQAATCLQQWLGQTTKQKGKLWL